MLVARVNDKDLEQIQKKMQVFNGFETMVYLPLFYKKDGSINMKNRMRLYQLYKRKLK